MDEPKDVDLVHLAQSGDRSAFGRLIAPRVAAAWRLIRAIGAGDVDADDVLQEALLMVWRDLPRLKNPKAFDPWVRRIVVNTTRHALRDRRVRVIPVATFDEVAVASAPHLGSDPDRNVAEREAIERAFGRLSVDHRTILTLLLLEELSMGQVAETLGVPIGTAKSRIHHARRALRTALEAESR